MAAPDSVTIACLGDPVAKGRPRFTRNGQHPYTPKSTKANAGYLRLAASVEMRDRAIFEGPLFLAVQAEFRIAASWSKKKKNAALLNVLRHTTRPDIDNIIKQVKDALSGVVWRDDRQVCVLEASKLYSNQPKLVITVTAL